MNSSHGEQATVPGWNFGVSCLVTCVTTQQELWNPRVEKVSSVNDPIDVLFVTPESSPKTVTLGGDTATLRVLTTGGSGLDSPVLNYPIKAAAPQITATLNASPERN